MAKKHRSSARRQPPPRVRDTRYDAIELTDEDLEVVVGGLSTEAANAHARYLGIVPVDSENPFQT
jgi:hypothetical protein